MKRFAQTAKDLQIKKLAKNSRIGDSPNSVDDLDNNDDEGILKDNEDQSEEEYDERSNLYILDKSKI